MATGSFTSPNYPSSQKKEHLDGGQRPLTSLLPPTTSREDLLLDAPIPQRHEAFTNIHAFFLWHSSQRH
ncbi:hypothetical protein TNCV_2256971 [Trichonephila clavipes]|nr:hypothetical protein TNCV_2256971 [Trichonephila clavipes]